MARVETTRLQFEISINGEKKILTSIKDVAKNYRVLKAQIDAGGLSQKEYNEKIIELGRLKAILKDHNQRINNAAKAQQSLSSATGTGGKGFKLFGKQIVSFDNLLKGTLIGAIAAAALKLVQFAKASFTAATEMEKTIERTNQVSGLVGEDLQEAAATATALGNTFGTDVTKGLDAANSAANAYKKEGEELGIVYQKALDGMGDRLVGLGDKGDEFLQQIGEYSGRAQEAGLSMDRFFNLVTEGINRGVPTDKLIDSIKEADIRLKTITDGQRASLEKAFGTEFTDRIVSGVQSGKISTIDALDEIAGGIDSLGENYASVQPVISDLFGGPGEDATTKYIALINDVGESLDDVVDSSNIYIQRKQELLAVEKESSKATAELAFQLDGSSNFFKKTGLIIKTGFSKFLSGAIELIRFFPENWEIAKARSLVAITKLVNGGIAILNKIIQPIQYIGRLLNEDFSFQISPVDTSFLEQDVLNKQQALQKALTDRRKEFEEQQRVETLRDQAKTQEAERLQDLQAQKRRYKELQNLTRKEKEALAKIEEEAVKKTQDLQIELIENATQRKIAKLNLEAEREISALKVTGEKRAVLEKLIREKTNIEILTIRKQAITKEIKEEEKATSAKIVEAEKRADAEIAAISSQAENVLEIRSQIETRKSARIEEIQREDISRQITRLRELAQLEIDATKGTKEEVATEQERIEQRLQQRIEQIQQSSISQQILRIQQEKLTRITELKKAEQELLQERRRIETQIAQEIVKIQSDSITQRITQKREENEQIQVELVRSSGIFSNEIVQIETQTARQIQAIQGESLTQRIELLKEETQQRIEALNENSKDYQERRIKLETQLHEEIATLRGEQINEQVETVREEGRRRIIALSETDQTLLQQIKAQETQLNEEIRTIRGETLNAQVEQITEEKQIELTALEQKKQEIITRRKELEKKEFEEIAKVKEEGYKETIKLDTKSQSEIERSTKASFDARLTEIKSYNIQRQAEITQHVLDEIESGEITADADEILKARLLEQERAFLEDKKALQKEFGVSTGDTQGEIDSLNVDKALESAQEQADRELAIDRLKYDAKVQLATTAASLINKAFEAQTEDRLRALDAEGERLEEWRDREIELAGDNTKQKLSIENKYSKQKEALDKKRAKEEKKLALKKMLVDFVLATAKAIAAAPPPANIPVILAQEALKVAPAALMASITFQKGILLDQEGRPIRSNQPAPKRIKKRGGVPRGPDHGRGGIRLIERSSGREIGEMEGGEPIMILSKKTYRNNRELVDELLYSSLHREGAPVRMQFGKNEDPMDFYRHRSKQTRFFQDGGILNAPITSPTADVIENTHSNPDNSLLIEKLDQLNDAYRKGKIILVSEREFDMIEKGIDRLKGDRLERAG